MSENVTELLAEITRQRAELKDAIGLIERLREEIRHLRATLDDRMIRQDAEIPRLRADLKDAIAFIERLRATMRGTLAPHPADDEPTRFTHDVAPSAPR